MPQRLGRSWPYRSASVPRSRRDGGTADGATRGLAFDLALVAVGDSAVNLLEASLGVGLALITTADTDFTGFFFISSARLPFADTTTSGFVLRRGWVVAFVFGFASSSARLSFVPTTTAGFRLPFTTDAAGGFGLDFAWG